MASISRLIPAAVRVQIWKWSWSITAWMVWGAFGLWLFGWLPSDESVQSWQKSPTAGEGFFPLRNAVTLVGILWYAFLCQGKVLWAICLPFYILFYPLWPAWIIARFLVLKLFGYISALGDTLDDNTEHATKRLAWPITTKSAWWLLFFVCLLGAGPPSWLVWIPPILAFPIWCYCLKVALVCAVAPKTAAEIFDVGRNCVQLLDSNIKAVREALDNGNTPPSWQWARNFVERIFRRRYSGERAARVLQQEALVIFSLSLVVGLVASSVFWGLVGAAFLSSTESFRGSYEFFGEGGLSEAIIWAWGCMTTTIDFPGETAPLWVKVIHALILATGLFQLTFLLACFSIMASHSVSRTAESVKEAVSDVDKRLAEVRGLESSEVVDPQAGPKSDHTNDGGQP